MSEAIIVRYTWYYIIHITILYICIIVIFFLLRRRDGLTSPTWPSPSTALTGLLASMRMSSSTAWSSICATRTAGGSPTCAATRPASTRSSVCVTGTTTWTVPPPRTGTTLTIWPTEQILPQPAIMIIRIN